MTMQDFFGRELERLKRKDSYRWLRAMEGPPEARMRVDGREVIVLCSSNYLGLATHPRLKAAAIEATERLGVCSAASRLIAGNNELYRILEERLAVFKRREAALVFSTGYMANLGVISAVVGDGDVVYTDALSHASIVDGCRLSRATVKIFPHNDVDALEDLLKSDTGFRRRLIAVDGVYSMDGDLTPLPDLVKLSKDYDALLMLDDAHGTGILGERGGGTAEHFGLDDPDAVDIEIGTLGKALGSFGAYVVGSRSLREYLINRSRSFIFTCALAPSALAAALATLDVLDEEPAHRQRLWENLRHFREGLHRLGLSTEPSATHILPVMTYDRQRTMALCERLLELGVFCQGIRPPTVPPGTSRLRFTVTAAHTRADLDRALEAVEKAFREFAPL
ncbi:MAG: kbl, 2-amino-3-ketobutyrate coenzyme A ligase, AKB ligase, Glycine C-acetyltransferase [candidate division NC10 bacterium CSP1-5]|nr:MAG: kbl, 2-amino-3-ketobutyrate coenzyme A ligase, AKB ligase, Glycine C-acetyltransferase [candidate division NC10 bacterium CSP1-5]